MGYQWIIEGKIGCHFPQKSGNPNFDVTQIFYNNDGVQANSTEISAVYFLTPAHAATIDAMSTDTEKKEELEKYSVWKRYWGYVENKELVMDTDGYVLMKYNPGLTDVSANSIGIFTTDSTNDNGRCVYILNEDGWLVGKSNASETKNINIEKYGLTGTLRTTTFSSPFVFKEGKDYWIQYYFENCQNAADAYYDGIQGTDYKRLALNNYYNSSPITGINHYNGETTGADWQMIDQMLSGNAYDVYKTNVQASYPINLANQPGEFYSKTSANNNLTYKGIITHQSDAKKPTIDETIGFSANDYVMIKNNSTSQGQHFNFYSRNDISIPGNTINYTEYLEDNNYLPNLLLTYNKKDTVLEFTGNAAQYNYRKYASHSLIDYLYALKKDLSLKYSTTADIHDTPPANPVDYDIYYHYGGTQWADEGIYTYVLMYHANGAWHKFSITDGTFFNEIGSLWDNISYSTIENNFTKLNSQPTVVNIASAPTSADIKHYLEINGREIF